MSATSKARLLNGQLQHSGGVTRPWIAVMILTRSLLRWMHTAASSSKDVPSGLCCAIGRARWCPPAIRTCQFPRCSTLRLLGWGANVEMVWRTMQLVVRSFLGVLEICEFAAATTVPCSSRRALPALACLPSMPADAPSHTRSSKICLAICPRRAARPLSSHHCWMAGTRVLGRDDGGETSASEPRRPPVPHDGRPHKNRRCQARQRRREVVPYSQLDTRSRDCLIVASHCLAYCLAGMTISTRCHPSSFFSSPLLVIVMLQNLIWRTYLHGKRRRLKITFG